MEVNITTTKGWAWSYDVRKAIEVNMIHHNEDEDKFLCLVECPVKGKDALWYNQFTTYKPMLKWVVPTKDDEPKRNEHVDCRVRRHDTEEWEEGPGLIQMFAGGLYFKTTDGLYSYCEIQATYPMTLKKVKVEWQCGEVTIEDVTHDDDVFYYFDASIHGSFYAYKCMCSDYEE